MLQCVKPTEYRKNIRNVLLSQTNETRNACSTQDAGEQWFAEWQNDACCFVLSSLPSAGIPSLVFCRLPLHNAARISGKCL